MTYDDTERETWSRRPPMTKHEKLEEIRRMKNELNQKQEKTRA